MIAFCNKSILKKILVKGIKTYQEEDWIIEHLDYDEHFGYTKESPVTCVVEILNRASDELKINHGDYEALAEETGIPAIIWSFIEYFFYNLDKKDANKLPVRVLEAIQPGADLSLVEWKLLHWVVTDETINPGIKHPDTKDNIKRCADAVAMSLEDQNIDECLARYAAFTVSKLTNAAEWYAIKATTYAAYAEDPGKAKVHIAEGLAKREAYQKMSEKLIELMEAESAKND